MNDPMGTPSVAAVNDIDLGVGFESRVLQKQKSADFFSLLLLLCEDSRNAHPTELRPWQMSGRLQVLHTYYTP